MIFCNKLKQISFFIHEITRNLKNLPTGYRGEITTQHVFPLPYSSCITLLIPPLLLSHLTIPYFSFLISLLPNPLCSPPYSLLILPNFHSTCFSSFPSYYLVITPFLHHFLTPYFPTPLPHTPHPPTPSGVRTHAKLAVFHPLSVLQSWWRAKTTGLHL